MVILVAIICQAFGEVPVDLTGTWVLNPEQSDVLEPFLVAQGVGWLQRRLADSAVPTLTVTGNHQKVRFHLKDALNERIDDLIVDGTSRPSPSRAGPVPCLNRWVGDSLQTVCELPTGTLTIERRRIQQQLVQVLTLKQPTGTVAVKRVFDLRPRSR